MHREAKTTIHFVRHGDAVPDAETPFSATDGYDAMGLSSKGAAQAEALAARLLRTTEIAAVYASPTRRAFETATAIARAFASDVTSDERLREIYLGPETLPASLAPRERARAIRERLESLAALALREGSWDSVPQGEAIAAVRARVRDVVAEIVARHAGEHVAVVSHAGTINAYLAELVGAKRDFFFPIGNTSLSSVRFAGANAMLLRLNDTAHLERAR